MVKSLKWYICTKMARWQDTTIERSPFFAQRGFGKTPLPKSPIWGNQTEFGWGIGRAKGDRLLRSAAVHHCPKRQKNVALTYILQAARTRMRIAHKKADRKGIFKGNSNSKPKAKTNSSEQAWGIIPQAFFKFYSWRSSSVLSPVRQYLRLKHAKFLHQQFHLDSDYTCVESL